MIWINLSGHSICDFGDTSTPKVFVDFFLLLPQDISSIFLILHNIKLNSKYVGTLIGDSNRVIQYQLISNRPQWCCNEYETREHQTTASVDTTLKAEQSLILTCTSWDGSRGGSGGSVEPPKVKQTQISWPYFVLW